ncbi:hypothetical protein ACWN8V_07130 [Vagococcus elongatus]|uniref:Uncharacterized protein n=1 Tax=Vagococcus elongatus TaxID=180344 RepID=A0A430AW65_9ENTE|nr:hypothetical protein [Vagococcus elongatus]RSU12304.1 hypothetical protein CBF29_06800 [Vagococcus elongatus]
MKELRALIELMVEFEGTINILGNDGKMYEACELIRDFHEKKEFKAMGVSYWLIDCFGKAYQGEQTTGGKNNIEPVSGLKEILDWVRELLDEDGHVYQHCDECGHHFTSGEGMFRYADGDYLCNGDCFRKKFPTDRDWHIYALEDWWKEYGGNEQWTEEELKKLSDEKLDELMSEAVDDCDFPCFYTEA